MSIEPTVASGSGSRLATELSVHRDQGVATVLIDRPARRNALTLAHWDRLRGLLVELSSDPGVRVVVVRSSSRAVFCAGADTSEFEEQRRDPESAHRYTQTIEAAIAELRSFARPTIATVRGVCVGGGVDLALACDVIVADTSASFRVFPAAAGIVLPHGPTSRIAAAFGVRSTRLMLLAGGAVSATRAHELGVVAEVCDEDALDARVDGLAGDVSSRPAPAIASTKTIIRAIEESDPDAADTAAALVEAELRSPDYLATLAALSERASGGPPARVTPPWVTPLAAP